jgi:hypothetical protein
MEKYILRKATIADVKSIHRMLMDCANKRLLLPGPSANSIPTCVISLWPRTRDPAKSLAAAP